MVLFLQDIAVSELSVQHFESLSELFPVRSNVFMLGTPQYGCMGEVGCARIVRCGSWKKCVVGEERVQWSNSIGVCHWIKQLFLLLA